MNVNLPILLLSLTFFTPFVHITTAWWDEHCAEGGQCANMIKSYEALIQGEGCRSFYLTGKCNRICTYSLRSLIGRHTWSKCTERCEWSKAITDGAQSWLAMCLARPASDVFRKDSSDDVTNGVSSDHSANAPPSATKGMTQGASNLRVASFCLFACSSLLCLLLLTKPALRAWLRYMFRRSVSAVKWLLTRNASTKTVAGKGPLDIGPNRTELRSLQRGARRHVKALRSSLD